MCKSQWLQFDLVTHKRPKMPHHHTMAERAGQNNVNCSRHYSKTLILPYPSKKNFRSTNASINLFNKDVTLVENRLKDLQTFIRGIADTNSDIAKHLDSSPSLFSELPSLYVQPFVQVHEEEEKILKDSRTGEEYLISTETGLLKYLKANFVIDLEVRPIELPLGDETFEFVLVGFCHSVAFFY